VTRTAWWPREHVDVPELVAATDRADARQRHDVDVRHQVLTIESLGLEWEIATAVAQPSEESAIARGADGRRVGVILLHGAMGDHRDMLPVARFLASNYGYRVSVMSYPGRYFLPDPAGEWPGDTIMPDGRLRTPMWHRGHPVEDDEYDVVTDRSDPVRRAKWGTLTFAAARPGTPFHERMAAWPVAFETALVELARRDFPADLFSVYVHGHSTGGPFAHMILQRIDNVVGLLGAETSSFPYIFRAGIGMDWPYAFNHLAILSWRNIAMYAGPEHGADLQWRLPWVMEEVLEEWERQKTRPFFKAEYFFNYAKTDQLEACARTAAARMKLSSRAEDELVRHFRGFARELPAHESRPVPPLLLGIVKGSRDHTVERYEKTILPMLAKIEPRPKVALVQYGGGVHQYGKPVPGLPVGALPAIAETWDEAIQEGFFVAGGTA
jgi:hypothetical protein